MRFVRLAVATASTRSTTYYSSTCPANSRWVRPVRSRNSRANPPPAGAQGQPRDGPGGPRRGCNGAPALGLPQPARPVEPAAGQQPPVPAQGHEAAGLPRVIPEGQWAPTPGPPQANQPVLAA